MTTTPAQIAAVAAVLTEAGALKPAAIARRAGLSTREVYEALSALPVQMDTLDFSWSLVRPTL